MGRLDPGLGHDAVFSDAVPDALLPVLDGLGRLLALRSAPDPLALRRTRAAALHETLLGQASTVIQALPDALEAVGPRHEQAFAEAALLWLHYGEVAGRPLLDTLGSRGLRDHPVDLEDADRARPILEAALQATFGWQDAELQAIRAVVARRVGNLAVKHALALRLAEWAEGGPEERAHLFRSIYGPVPVAPGDVDLVVTYSHLFFALPYGDEGWVGDPLAARRPSERAGLEDFLRRIREQNTFMSGRFPAFGVYLKEEVSDALVADLHDAVIDVVGDLPEAVIRATLETMVQVLPTPQAERFLVHDCWGHVWQEALADFEWLYDELVHLTDDLVPETGSRAGLPEGERLASAFAVDGGRTRLDTERLHQVVEADLRFRIRAAFNAHASEALADLVETKHVRELKLDPDDYPSSSLLPHAPLRLDLSLQDARSHARAWSAAYRRFIGQQRRRDGFADALRGIGLPDAGLRAAVDQAADEIQGRWATALDDDWEPPGITVHRRMALSTLALDAELVAWLQRSDHRWETLRQQHPGIARWQVPEACMDLLVLLLAVFYEQDQDVNIWHLDELLRESLWTMLDRFGAALRQVAGP